VCVGNPSSASNRGRGRIRQRLPNDREYWGSGLQAPHDDAQNRLVRRGLFDAAFDTASTSRAPETQAIGVSRSRPTTIARPVSAHLSSRRAQPVRSTRAHHRRRRDLRRSAPSRSAPSHGNLDRGVRRGQGAIGPSWSPRHAESRPSPSSFLRSRVMSFPDSSRICGRSLGCRFDM
jgi:hypothetical protein